MQPLFKTIAFTKISLKGVPTVEQPLFKTIAFTKISLKGVPTVELSQSVYFSYRLYCL